MDTTLEQNMGYTDSNIVIDAQSKSYLETTAKWAYFLSIIGFIFIGFIVLGGIFFMLFMGGMAASSADAGLMGGVGFIGILYLLIGLLYFLPILYLFRFSSKMKQGLRDNHQVTVTEAFLNLKKVYKFFGIMTIIVLALYVVMIIGTLIFGAALSI